MEKSIVDFREVKRSETTLMYGESSVFKERKNIVAHDEKKNDLQLLVG